MIHFIISKDLLIVFFIFLYSYQHLPGPLFYLLYSSKFYLVRFFIFFTFSKDLLMVRFFIFLYSIRFYLVRFFMKGKKADH